LPFRVKALLPPPAKLKIDAEFFQRLRRSKLKAVKKRAKKEEDKKCLANNPSLSSSRLRC
jgi:hypothetical protein